MREARQHAAVLRAISAHCALDVGVPSALDANGMRLSRLRCVLEAARGRLLANAALREELGLSSEHAPTDVHADAGPVQESEVAPPPRAPAQTARSKIFTKPKISHDFSSIANAALREELGLSSEHAPTDVHADTPGLQPATLYLDDSNSSRLFGQVRTRSPPHEIPAWRGRAVFPHRANHRPVVLPNLPRTLAQVHPIDALAAQV